MPISRTGGSSELVDGIRPHSDLRFTSEGKRGLFYLRAGYP